MAQLCYKDAMQEMPAGVLAGLKEVVRYCRCGDTWKKLLAHMSILAGEKNAGFRDSLYHAYLADEINWANRVEDDPMLVPGNNPDRRAGYKVCSPPTLLPALSHASARVPPASLH